MAEQNLKDKTVKGVGWSITDNVSRYIVNFIIGIILARLLNPDDYGLLGLVGIFTVICETIITGGFGSALIRKKNVSDEDYNTVFVVQLSISTLLYLILFFSAPLIADFFGRDELIKLVRVSSLGMVIGAFSIVQQTKLTKRIDFKSQTIITVITTIVGGIAGITMAFCGWGVWALVFSNIISQILRSVGLCLANKWFPNFKFSFDSFKELFGYGWKILVSGLIDNVWKEMNQFVVGKFYNPAMLGQYTRANHFSSIFSSNITSVIQRVTFPVLSNIQNDSTRMINAYRKIIKTTMFGTTVCMFALGAISEPLINCLIGEKWHQAALFLPLLCISQSLYPLHAINLNMLQVQGRSDLFLRLEIIKKTIALGPLLVGAFISIYWMLIASIFTGFISFFLNSYYTGKFLGYSSWMQIKDVIPSYVTALIVATPIYFLKYIPVSDYLILPIQIITGIIFFVFVSEKRALPEYFEIKNIVVSKLKKRNKTH